MRSLLIVLLLIGMATAQLPSDLIIKQPAPACIDLSNTAPSSALAIDALNPELGPFKLIETANLGHYNAALVEETQGDLDTATEAVKGFLVGDEAAGNGTIEPMNLTEYNGTMVWF
jgi:hypothetical protein